MRFLARGYTLKASSYVWTGERMGYRRWMSGIAALALSSGVALSQQHLHGQPLPAQTLPAETLPGHTMDHAHAGHVMAVGTVNFVNSCTPSVQGEFSQGVAMLHSFWYSAGEQVVISSTLAHHFACAQHPLPNAEYFPNLSNGLGGRYPLVKGSTQWFGISLQIDRLNRIGMPYGVENYRQICFQRSRSNDEV